MTRFMIPLALLAMLSFTVASNAAIISDDFDVDSSADYTLADLGARDGATDFAFDYSTLGIASAPNSVGATTLGLRYTVNDTANTDDSISAFHNTAVTAPNYLLSVDVYMGVGATSGTTEFGNVGVAGDGVTTNTIFSPIGGSGHYVSFTGEGGSSSDFRHSTPSTFAIPSGDASYLNSTNTTNATGDTYQTIFAGGDFPGSPGNRWTTLTVEVLDGTITYAFDGTPIIATAYDSTDGNQVSLSYADVFSGSASPLQSNYIIYDNLTVTALVPEPTSLVLVGFAATMLGFRRRNG